MNLDRLDDVLAHHVDAIVHDFHAIERASAVPRVSGRVGGFAIKLENDGIHGVGAAPPGEVLLPGVPGDRGVDAVKRAITRHVHLALQGFFRRTAEADDLALRPRFAQRARRRNRGIGAGCAEEVVPAAVALFFV